MRLRMRRRLRSGHRPRARARLLTALAVGAALTGGCSPARGGSDEVVPAAQVAEPARGARNGWRLVWSDEFQGAAHSRPDRRTWVFDRGGEPQWGNHEWQYYTDRPGNASLDGRGDLVLTARRERLRGMVCSVGPCNITSGRMTTKGRYARAYGRFEARIRVPRGQGLWPAFWMLGANSDKVRWPGNGEIDVMEVVGRQPGTVHGSVHGPGYVKQGIEKHTALAHGRSLADGFHTYRVDWMPDRIVWYLDDKPYGVARSGRLRRGQKWVFDHPHYLLLNLAVGGDWPGPPDRKTPFPARMVVDYVRVYAPA
ncbi:hydrolase [Streptomyces cinnamoneus]|uniref:Hydrolase n=1 Tax=Streptomyces cinnamoneus TaxID=53446 RepID=A0A2G1XI95_STRCJ|nr:glycoside hydrolase family 16 protein [Streptomyces cinnamoneus]PHQ50849.1 hydrolase [Streptomyces cinnamoneus]PPT13893.1 glycoside hydrolase family 16 protein [Streptomyces cinnamoneus]